jgi:hypothetical protein
MANSATAGLVVTAHNNTLLNTSTFDNIGITTPAPDFALTATPSSQTVIVGSNTSYTATVTGVSGFTGTVSLSVSGLPTGTSANFNPTSITGSGNSTLSVSTGSSTASGSYPLTLTGTSGSLVHTTAVTLTVTSPPPPDFTISGSPSTQTVIVGGNTSYTATVTGVSGFTGTVSLSVSGLPTGTSANFNPTSITGSGSSTLSVSTLASAPPGNYTLTLTGTSGSLTHSTTVSFVISGVSVSAGWTDVDIGSPGMVGSATSNAGTFTVNGGGADIWYTSDQFNYVYQSLTGNLTITARVASQQNTDSWAKVGVMIRETTAANSAYVFLMLTPANGVNMQYRPTTGSNAVQLAQVAALVAPYWVRLVRSGNTFTGYSSADGVTWTQVGSISLTMANSATAGLVVTAHNNTLLNTSTFDNIGITTP